MRFQDPRPDGRAVVYGNVQADPLVAEVADLLAGATLAERILARAVMNGESADAVAWRTMAPALFGPSAEHVTRAHADAVLAASLSVADRGDDVRSQIRGAIVEAVTERLLRRRATSVRRERRILFDGVASDAHPFDVTVEDADAPEAYDCKWGARGINDEVLLQLDSARTAARAEGHRLHVALVVFDAARSCAVRLARSTAPRAGTRIVTLEHFDALARVRST